MKLFKKLYQKENANEADAPTAPSSIPKSSFFRWFTKKSSAVAATVEEGQKHKNNIAEIEFVPKTEITGSRQALSNIQLTFHGESSGVSRNSTRDNNDEVDTKAKRGCENRFCCGVVTKSRSTIEENENADDGDDESIKSFHHKNFTLYKSQSQSEASLHETNSRRSSNLHVDSSKDFYICYEPAIDYGRLEVPGSDYPSVMDWPSINYGDFIEVKKKKKKPSYDIFSSIEHQLDESKYNILNCMLFNCQYHHYYDSLGSGCRPSWKLEDYNDDYKNTPMDHDTKTIKEFYRLNELSDILVHYHDVIVEASHSFGRMKEGIIGFMSWLVFKGKEIKEHHKIKDKRSWLEKISIKSPNGSKY